MDSTSSETHAYTLSPCLANVLEMHCTAVPVLFFSVHMRVKQNVTSQVLLLKTVAVAYLFLSFTAEQKYRSRLTRGTFSRIQDCEKAGSSSMTQGFMFLLSMCQAMLT